MDFPLIYGHGPSARAGIFRVRNDKPGSVGPCVVGEGMEDIFLLLHSGWALNKEETPDGPSISPSFSQGKKARH